MLRRRSLLSLILLFAAVSMARAGFLDDLVEAVVGENTVRGLAASHGLTPGTNRPEENRHFLAMQDASGMKKCLRFAIVSDSQVNAFAAPGGQVFVTQGMLDAVQGQSQELAFALGHEIGHIANGDTKRLARQALAADVLFGKANADAQTAVALVQRMLTYKQSQEQEFAADAKGQADLVKAGYHPSGGLALMRRLETIQSKNPNIIDLLFATHPPTPERSERLKDQMLIALHGSTFRTPKALAADTGEPLAVPFLSQGPGNNNCGPVCLAMAAHFVQGGTPNAADVRAINNFLGVSDAAYKSTAQIASAAAGVYSIAGTMATRWTLAEILDEIRAGGPVIVGVTAGPLPRRNYNYADGHFVLVIGFTDTEIICNDPGSFKDERIKYPRDAFQKAMAGPGAPVVYGFRKSLPPPATLGDNILLEAGPVHLGDDERDSKIAWSKVFTLDRAGVQHFADSAISFYLRATPKKDPYVWVNRIKIGQAIARRDQWEYFKFRIPAGTLREGENLIDMETYIADLKNTYDDCDIKDITLSR